MDLFKAIQELYEEKRRLDEVIARLEELSRARELGIPDLSKGARKRGRKHMSDEERAEVSQRMKEFWARKRKAQKENK